MKVPGPCFPALLFVILLSLDASAQTKVLAPPGQIIDPYSQANPSSSPYLTPGGRMVGYYTQWGIYARNYHVKNIATSGSAEKLTVINYAFGHIKDGICVMVTQTGVMDAWADYQKIYSASESVDGVADQWNQPLRGNFNQLKKLKMMYPHLKVLISLGGWTWSEGFSDAALTPQSRKKAAASCIDIYIKGNLPQVNYAGGPGVAAGIFDGVDIDWEYPAMPAHPHNTYRPEDTENFTLFLAEFRKQLDEINPDLLLTIAGPAGKDKIDKIEVENIHPYLDWINVMTFDFHGGWDPAGPTNFHAQLHGSPNDPSSQLEKLYNCDFAMHEYMKRGVPSIKLSMGIPFYGRGWTGVTSANNGLYQPASGPAPGTHEQGVDDYKVLKGLGYPGFRDPITKSYWIFNDNTFWSFDDPVSIATKMVYIKERFLGGVMIWSLDGDTAKGELIAEIQKGF